MANKKAAPELLRRQLTDWKNCLYYTKFTALQISY